MDLELSGKSVIVTGGGSNIGRAIALAFGAEGANVTIGDIEVEQAERVAALARERGAGGAQVIKTDVRGVYVLLEAAQRVGVERFLHISTDEVYGDIAPGLASREDDRLHPRSPYAASKAGGEMMCLAFRETYGLPLVITRGSNNLGPHQYPEKAVPPFITNALDDEPLPVYGDGMQTRDWLYVQDHCEALDMLLHRGEPGEAYNIAAGNEQPNLEVAKTLLHLLDKPKSLIRFVEDRPGHDRRYSLDTTKVRSLGWQPRHDVGAALEQTVAWYRDNRWWWEKIKSGEYREYYQRQYGARLRNATPSGD